MDLSDKQTGVAKGMATGAAVAISIVTWGLFLNPFAFDATLSGIQRLTLAIQCSLLPVLFLVICIGRLARHRFFSPDDIDGGGFSNGTRHAQVLQSLLQNTLEQAILAIIVYMAWALIMPAKTLSVVPLAALAFGLGRILFIMGYARGAPSRAIGFTLSFYTSIIMFICIVGYSVWQKLVL